MQFTLPFIDVLTIPSGAGPNDSRIEIDGVNGEIRIYLLSVLVGRWRPDDFQVLGADNALIEIDPDASGSGNPAIFMRPPDSPGLGASVPAQIVADFLNTDETPYLLISGTSPLGEVGAPRIDLYAPNAAGISVVPYINLAPNAGGGVGGFVDIPMDAAKTSDLRVGNESIPRGELDRIQATANDALVAATEELFDICVINDLPVISGRKYDIEGQTSFDAVTAKVTFRLRYTEDGTVPTTASTILEESVFNAVAAGTTGGTGRIKGRYVPASNLDLSVGLFLLTSVNITAFGINNEHGYISATDVGA